MIKPIVLEFKLVQQGSLRAFVTLQIGPLVIYKARYICQDGMRGYVQGPQLETVGADGQRRFTPLLKWPEEWKAPILAAVLEAIQDHPHGIRQRAATELGREVERRAGLSSGTDGGRR